MGLVMHTLLLKNPRRPELAAVEVVALADTGAVHLCIPEAIRARLELDAIDHKNAVLAGGSRVVACVAS